MCWFTQVRVNTPEMSEESSVPDDDSTEEADAPPCPAGPDESARQKSSAPIPKMDPAAVLAKIWQNIADWAHDPLWTPAIAVLAVLK